MYDGHEIDDNNMYCVECKAKNIEESILFPQLFSRCYGSVLKEAKKHNIDYKIHYYRKPCNIENVNYKKAVDDLYNLHNDLETLHKKYIVNKTTGLLEKKYNTAHICKVFKNREEAQYYQIKYGGRIIGLSESIKVEDNQMQDNPLEYGIINCLPRDNLFNVNYKSGKKIYLYILEKKERLIEGFRPIKEIIYCKMAIKLFNMYKDVTSKGIEIKGIKTDALLISKSKSEVEHLFTFDNKIGGVKFETGKSLTNKKLNKN